MDHKREHRNIGQMQNETEIQAKKKADCKKFGFLGSQIEGRDYDDYLV